MARIGINVERLPSGQVVGGVMFPDDMPAESLTHLAQALHAAISQGRGCARSHSCSCCTRTDPAAHPAPQTAKAPEWCASV